MQDQTFHRNFLEFGNYRYLKIAAIVAAGSLVAYWRDTSPLGPYRGTTVGLWLGSIGGVLILWLMWLVKSKRLDRAACCDPFRVVWSGVFLAMRCDPSVVEYAIGTDAHE